MRRTRSLRLFLVFAIAIVCTVVVLVISNRGIATGQSSYVTQSQVMQQFTQFTNELRARQNLPAMQQNRQLEQSAIAKLQDMQQLNYWGHRSPEGDSFSYFIWQYDADAQLVGENLARCFESYDAAFAALVKSPAHYAVLTGDFTDIGVASQKMTNGCESIVMHVSRS